MINGQTFFDQPVKSDMGAYDNIQNIETAQGVDYTTSCLLDYPYFKEYYKITEIDLNKQQAPDAEPKAIQCTNFTGNLDLDGNTTFFIIEEAKETILDFSQGTKGWGYVVNLDECKSIESHTNCKCKC